MPPEFHYVRVSHRHCRVEAATADGRRRPVATLRQLTSAGGSRWMLLARRGRPTGRYYPDLAAAQAALNRPDPELLRRLGLNPA